MGSKWAVVPAYRSGPEGFGGAGRMYTDLCVVQWEGATGPASTAGVRSLVSRSLASASEEIEMKCTLLQAKARRVTALLSRNPFFPLVP